MCFSPERSRTCRRFRYDYNRSPAAPAGAAWPIAGGLLGALALTAMYLGLVTLEVRPLKRYDLSANLYSLIGVRLVRADASQFELPQGVDEILLME